MDEILPYLIILALAVVMHAQNLPIQPLELTAMRLSTDLTP
jgi:hypothetical protein